MTSTAYYNEDHPLALLAAGTLQGKAVSVDTSSIRPCEGRPIFVASLTGGPALKLLCGGVPGTVAVKATEDDRTRAPRNPRREALLLAKLQHPNVLSLLNGYLAEPSPSSPAARVTLFTPFYPHTLRDLLIAPSFTLDESPSTFPTLATSIAHQLVAAVSHLHEHGVAHRDVNPNNVVLSAGGRVVLIDLGIAIERGDEEVGAMHFEVGTGPYRAPEIIFGSRAYDPLALDLWALGATLAALFRPLVYPRLPSPDSEDSFERYYHQCATPPPEPSLERQPLFDGGASDFLLAASVFRVLGTPTVDTWPEAHDLPTFGRFTFASFPPTPLATHLPHLPDSATTLLGVLEGLLRISAQARTPAQEALRRIEEAASDGDGPRLLLPDDLSEEERGAYGVVGDEASPPTLRAMLVEMFAP
ncbi:CMGC/CDK protein kinase [Rhodotorula diobovata]|uniref:cyclin-dependent kinase n=1 Tax=Rhodotorula diobovata TaxID=5288 RepID=A0A5C5G0R9_9BASI|nr:CMGC/CDK protein kinase [Rhodotorula diobovata]